MLIRFVCFGWMRFLGVIIIGISFFSSNAQTLLPVEDNKVVFYEVNAIDSLPKEILYQNAYNWMISQKFTSITDSLTSEGHKLTATSEFPVYAQGYLTKRQNGVITYTIQIEVKEKKYRYRFADFVFHYYRENRNYQLVPTGKVKPLEEESASGWQKTWESNKRTTHTMISNLIVNLKKDIVHNPAQEKMAKGPAKEW